MRKTKIICTIGPRTDSSEMLERLAHKGMNVARLNMSHGDFEYHQKIIDKIKKLNKRLHFPLSILIDLQGPEIRLGNIKGKMELKEGDKLKLIVSGDPSEEHDSESNTVSINYPSMIRDVNKGETILIDDGQIALKAMSFEEKTIICKVMNKGSLSSKKCVNLPGISIDIPSITEKDIECVKFAIKNDADFIALSFIRHRDDILQVKEILEQKNALHIKTIAKIEDPEGVKNLDYIIEAADAIMVARGDLGVELPLEEVPILQKKIIRKCQKLGKPVIIATHLLESMIKNPRPTRAEVTDIANAVFDGVDCIMLSGETTIGDYPIECVKIFDRVARRIEKEIQPKINGDFKAKSIKDEIAKNACITAEDMKAKAILVFTNQGRLTRMINKHRPRTNIYAFTEKMSVAQKIMMYWGVLAFKISFGKNYEKMVTSSINMLIEKGFIEKNRLVTIVTNVNVKGKNIESLEMRYIE